MRFCTILALVAAVTSTVTAGWVTVVDAVPTPVINRSTSKRFGVLGGFETGNAIADDYGMLHLFYGEKTGNTTYPWKMGWTDRIGHWTSTDGGLNWSRLETVMAKASLWSSMPFFDASDGRWKLFYCNESVGDTRTAVAANKGRDSIRSAQNWTFPTCGHDCPPSVHPSINTYSISNPFRPNGLGGNFTVFLDHGGLFEVMLAQSRDIAGPFELMAANNSATQLFPESPAKYPGNVTTPRAWIENPIVAAVANGFVATWDYVQGGGEKKGTPLPYLGFSWSRDGLSWPANQSALVPVKTSASAEAWTDLVRTPTGLLPDPSGKEGRFKLFYAARDTRLVQAPYTNCSVNPHHPRIGGAPPPPPPGWEDGCYWGIGSLTVEIALPKLHKEQAPAVEGDWNGGLARAQ
jgi:hypothetical protein